MKDMLVSPDGNAIAIRSDVEDAEAWNAWGVMHSRHGGHWSSTRELYGWTFIAATEQTLTAPEPEILEDFPPPESMQEG